MTTLLVVRVWEVTGAWLGDAKHLLLMGGGIALIAATVCYSWATRVTQRDGTEPDAKKPRRAKDRSDVLLGLGNGFFAGAAIALAVFGLQQALRNQIDRAATRSAYRTSVALTWDLSGFDPAVARPGIKRRHCSSKDVPAPPGQLANNLRKWYFASKKLDAAHLDGVDLSSSTLRDASLRGASLACVALAHANLQRADLSGADLSDANLNEADLRGANLDGLIWNVWNWEDARVDVATCWPDDFLAKLKGKMHWLDPSRHTGSVIGRDGHKHPTQFGRMIGHVCGSQRVIKPSGEIAVSTNVPAARAENETGTTDEMATRLDRFAEISERMTVIMDHVAKFLATAKATQSSVVGPSQPATPSIPAASASPTAVPGR